MAHTCYGEIRQLFETFTRVWGSGGQASLHLHTQAGKSRAMLDIQLGPPAAPRPGAPDVQGEGPGPTPGPQRHPQHCQQRPRRRGPASRARDAARRNAWLLRKQKTAEPESDMNTVRSTDTETVTAEKDSQKKIVTSLPSYNKEDEVDWTSEPLQEDGVVGVRISRRTSDIPQVDGARDTDAEQSPEEIVLKVEEKETQTDTFLTVDEGGQLVGPELDLLYDVPPPTVYHPVWGIGIYHSTDEFKEFKTNTDRKAHCYRYENGDLRDA